MGDEMNFGMPLDEAMETQRAIRRIKTDPVPDELVLRLVGLALKAPTGSNAQNWEFIVVKDPQVKAGLARLQPAAVGSVRRHWAAALPGQPQAAEDRGGGAVAGGPFRGGAGDRGALHEGGLLPVLALSHDDIFRLDLPGGAKFTPGGAGREPGGGAYDHPALEPDGGTQDIGLAVAGDALRGDPVGLAPPGAGRCPRSLRADDQEGGARGGVV